MNGSKRARLTSFVACTVFALAAFAPLAAAQDGTMYPMENPDEPNAILLGTGGVAGQDLPETWFRQWGDPMARNITTATLTPFLPDPDKANGAAVIVAQGDRESTRLHSSHVATSYAVVCTTQTKQ